MATQSIAQLSSGPVLEQISGDRKGEVFELGGDRITIGRSENNDIVIVGEAVSRYHASIERAPEGGFYIKDQQSKNGVQVNGTTVSESALRSGDVVQIGSFIFRFYAPVGSELPEESESDEGGSVYHPPAPSEKKQPNKRLIIYGGLGVVLMLVYLMSGEDTKKPEGDKAVGSANSAVTDVPLPPPPAGVSNKGIAGQEDPLAPVDELEGKRTADLKEAEQYFKKGLREYTNENYHRGIEFFRLALTLNKSHELSDYYLKLSYYQVDTEAKKNFEIGEKYFKSMQYSRAIYHFSETISLLQHRPTDPRIKKAEQFIAASKKRLQEAQQFP